MIVDITAGLGLSVADDHRGADRTARDRSAGIQARQRAGAQTREGAWVSAPDPTQKVLGFRLFMIREGGLYPPGIGRIPGYRDETTRATWPWERPKGSVPGGPPDTEPRFIRGQQCTAVVRRPSPRRIYRGRAWGGTAGLALVRVGQIVPGRQALKIARPPPTQLDRITRVKFLPRAITIIDSAVIWPETRRRGRSRI